MHFILPACASVEKCLHIPFSPTLGKPQGFKMAHIRNATAGVIQELPVQIFTCCFCFCRFISWRRLNSFQYMSSNSGKDGTRDGFLGNFGRWEYTEMNNNHGYRQGGWGAREERKKEWKQKWKQINYMDMTLWAAFTQYFSLAFMTVVSGIKTNNSNTQACMYIHTFINKFPTKSY